ncbi:hypothetical protein Q6348_13080 [Isoptericola sp. b441]|uniref:Uncharacterized protein n=1 Tax=Actinotalea lenta TaxID=3064654 RepID=A0ABT9DCT0_9CELL|nr:MULTISPECIES: hypothetical protein [unclassified Isoptericola]MDO8108129.1 hypothetical protein [Isoptericola sp. b441]MDO8120201.1 hypothetical protein [Isoptericola sp. b490]
MTTIVKAATVTLLSATLAIVGLPLGGGSTVSTQSTGCCKASF